MESKQYYDTVNEIQKTTQLPQGAVALWWLGQSGFVLRGASTTLIIDPFLSEDRGRQVVAPFSAQDCPPVDFVLCTHEHMDHMDLPALQTIMHNSARSPIIAPRPIVELMTQAGIPAERVIAAQPGEVIKAGEATLYPIPAMHGISFPPTVYSFGFEQSDGQYRFLGYVIELDGIRIYHPGDTIIYDGLIERLRPLAIDLALLPINGRSYFREQQGLVGNMDEREAADLAAAAGISAVIPTHYDMFAANVGRPGFFVDYIRSNHPQLVCYLPAYGRRLVYIK